MKDFVEYLIKNLVSQPDAVLISQKEDEKGTLIEISVAAEDIGKVLGRKGRMIRSIRTLIGTIGARLGLKVHVVVLQ